MIEKETSKNNLETANDALKKELKDLKDQVEKENNSKETPKGTSEKIELRPAEKQASNDLENFLDKAFDKTESKKSTQQDNQPNTPQRRNPERPAEVQEGIDEASDNLRKLSEQEDINFVADWARKKIGELGEFFS